jgi:hypothetical protein
MAIQSVKPLCGAKVDSCHLSPATLRVYVSIFWFLWHRHSCPMAFSGWFFRSPDHQIPRDHPISSISTFGTTGDFGNLFFQLHDLQRTLFSVMFPAHNQMAFLRIMHVLLEISAFIFKFNPYALPLAGLNFPVGLAVWNSVISANQW